MIYEALNTKNQTDYNLTHNEMSISENVGDLELLYQKLETVRIISI